MANRYWVGGTGTWSAANTANWSASSGGAGGASVPTAADAVIFDGLSNFGVSTTPIVVTVASSTTVLSISTSAFGGNIAFGTSVISVAGSGSNVIVWGGSVKVSGTPTLKLTYNGATLTSVVFPTTLPETEAVNLWVSGGAAATYQLNFSGGGVFGSLDFTDGVSTNGYRGSVNWTAAITVYGSWKSSAVMSSPTGGGGLYAINFSGTIANQTITTNGVSFGCPIAIQGTLSIGANQNNVASVVLGGAFVSTSNFRIFGGNFDTAGYSFTVGNFNANNASANYVQLRTSTITCTDNSGSPWQAGGTTNLDAGTSTIVFSSSGTKTFAGAGKGYHNFVIGGTTGAGTVSFTGNNYFRGTISSTKTVAHTLTFPSAGITTINNWTVTGTAGNLVTVNASATTTTLDIMTRANSGNTLGYFAITNVNFRATPFYAGATSTITGGTNGYALSYVAPFTHYWVGGAGTWDATSTLRWSASSGGPSGATAPFADELVVFDSLSGTPGIGASITGNVFCGGITTSVTGWTIRAGTTPVLYIAGNISFTSGTTWSSVDSVLNPFGTMSVNTGGTNIVGTVIIRGGGTVSLAAAFSAASSTVNHQMGTLATNGYTFSCNIFTPDASFMGGTLSLGASVVSFNSYSDTSNPVYTVSPGTSTITMTNATAGFAGWGRTYYNIAFSSTASNASYTFNANARNSTFNSITAPGPAAIGRTNLVFGASFTVTNGISTTGTAGNRRVLISSNQAGMRYVLTAGASGTLTDADFRDVYVKGTTFSGTRVSAVRSYGVTASAPKTVYWNLTGAQNWSANAWAATPTGTPSTDNFPLIQDTATFTNAGAATTVTLDTAITYVGTVDLSGRTTAMNLTTTTTPEIYGNLLQGTGVTYTGAINWAFNGDVTQTITSNGKSHRGNITVNLGATVSLGDAFDNLSASVTYATDFTITVNDGTFQTNSYAVSTRSFISTANAVTFLYLGTSTFTITPTATTLTGLNINTAANCYTGTPTINFNNNVLSSVFNGGGRTYGTVNFTKTTTTSDTGATINGANTFTNLYIYSTPADGRATVILGANQTVTGVFGTLSTTAVRRVYVTSSAAGTRRTITVNGSYSLSDIDFQDIAITGTAGTATGTRIGDAGNNTGITFDAPKTVYWNLAGSQAFTATGWAPSSGGTPAANNFPLPQDTAVFDNAGAAGTVSLNTGFNFPGLNMSGRTVAMTLSGSAPFIYGNLSLGTGVTISVGNNIYMAGRGTTTLTSNGKTYSSGALSYFNIATLTGTVQLTDAFSTDSNLALVSGTLDTMGYAVNAAYFTVTGTTAKYFNLRNSTITLSGDGTATQYIWYNLTSSNTYIYTTPQSTIVLSSATTNLRTFLGGGRSYGRLVIGGNPATSETRISDSNAFSELASTKTVAHTINLIGGQVYGKWSVTGSAGNVVTILGSGTNYIYGSASSGIDYLDFSGAILSFNAGSTGEFYAGANTIASGANIIKTAPPAPTTRYWVGGSGTWNNSSTTNWSASSGGPGGASVPTSLDNVVFDSLSSTASASYTVTLVGTSMRCNQLTIGGPGGANVVTFAGTGVPMIHGNITLAATGVSMIGSGNWILSGSTSGKTITTNGVDIATSGYTFNILGYNCEWSQTAALSIGGALTLTAGTFNTNNYALGAYLICNSVYPATLNLGSSSVSGGSAPDFGASPTTNFTFNPGTSTITSGASTLISLAGNGRTFYNYVFSGATANSTYAISGANTFNNLTFAGPATAGLITCSISANQTINGTLSRTATNGSRRYFFKSDVYGTQRTLTVASAGALSDIDFQDIVVTGAAAPISGTRLGDATNNSGITFDAAKTVYWNLAGAQLWQATGWAPSSGGTPDVNSFPLPQDTAVFNDAGAITTMTISTGWSLPTLDMSARTLAMTLTLSVTNLSVYGSWYNGTGVTISGSNTLTFAGRNKTVTLTGGYRTFTPAITFNAPGGTIQLGSDLYQSNGLTAGITLTAGTLAVGAYSVYINGLDWNASAGAAVTGTGRIVLMYVLAKSFNGGGISYGNVSLVQGNNAGVITVTGNNILYDIVNDFKAFNPGTFTLNSTIQYLTQFTGAGTAGNVLTLSGTSISAPAALVLSSSTTQLVDYLAINFVKVYPRPSTWLAGTNSTTTGGAGWLFSSGGTAYSVTILETATATDLFQARGIFRSAVSETGTASDTFSAGFRFDASVLETALALDTASAVLIFNRAISETATGSDSISSSGVFVVTVSDTAAASDLVSANARFAAVVLDSASGADQTSTQHAVLALVAETSTAADAVSAQGSFGAVVQESGTATDAVQAANTLSVAIAETGTAADLFAANLSLLASVAETATISDLPSARMVFVSQVAEQGTAVDLTAVAPSVFGPRVSELTVASDAFRASGTFNVYVTNLATASDEMAGRYLWNPIDDTQTPDWNAVNNTQSGTWVLVDDSQSATWQNVNNAQTTTWGEVDDSQNPGWTSIQQNP